MLKPQFIGYTCDIIDLENLTTSQIPLFFTITVDIGPEDGEGQDSFQIFLCTSQWWAASGEPEVKKQVEDLGLRPYFIPEEGFKAEAFEAWVEDVCETCPQADNWDALAAQLAEKLGAVWEFADTE